MCWDDGRVVAGKRNNQSTCHLSFSSDHLLNLCADAAPQLTQLSIYLPAPPQQVHAKPKAPPPSSPD